tara:strand:- start:744 stop:947 length:204 start_codon:yes stop_codon:yes gene_type:complete
MIIISRPQPESKKSLIICCFVTIAICFLIYKFLQNITVEVEKFSNTPIVYSSAGYDLNDLNIKKRIN